MPKAYAVVPTFGRYRPDDEVKPEFFTDDLEEAVVEAKSLTRLYRGTLCVTSGGCRVVA